MPNSAWVIIVSRSSCQIARIQGDQVEELSAQPLDWANPAKAADSCFATLDENGYRGQSILVALESSLCVSLTVDSPSASQRRNRTTMAFLLEDHLPWAAEEMVFDFNTSSKSCHFIAIESTPLAGFISNLEQRGVRIDHISPLAQLALENHLLARRGRGKHVLAWGRDTSIDLWLVESGDRPTSWALLEHSAEAVIRTATSLVLNDGVGIELHLRHIRPEVVQTLAARFTVHAEDVPHPSLRDAALAQATLVLSGRHRPGVQLRRDSLATADQWRPLRRHLNVLQTLVGLLLLLTSIMFWSQTQATKTLCADAIHEQENAFRRVFPNQPVPVGIRTRLAAEHTRLKELHGTAKKAPEAVDSLTVLAQLLRCLPRENRFQLLEIRIDSGELYIVGRTCAHGDADVLATAIRASGLSMAPPSTHQLQPQGVEFRVAGQLSSPLHR